MTQKLRWGIMSCAQIATGSVMPAIQESETGMIQAIASRELEKSRAVAAEFGIAQAYGSYEELLADPDVDAVYIPLPNHLHCEWVIRAAEAGKHILCEKPIALNSSEAAQMVAACRTAGVHLAEAYMYRHHPRIVELRDIIASGEIGALRSIRGTFTYNDATDTSNIRFKSAWGGGSLYDVGCYPLTAARLLFGTEPEAVTVQALFSPEHDNVDMMASGLVEFPGDRNLIFDCGMWAYNRQLLEVLGTLGRIEIPMPFNARFDDAEFIVYTGGESRCVKPVGANPYVQQADHFAAAVFSGKRWIAEEDPVLNMKLIETCLESARKRERISLV
ncbi:Gfo/Idh/MocA family oxidoreductase [Paenibacillus sp. MMS20-IR301]|uniref:Gfo/Idh/MocA family protein n=1 Tax=Paenibacillus sp. MMS20-IR301 TaxID=2895946 RepID=UPI0028E9DB48|nr:Gfo/Idh/MocA family oxidoreductase [Paenibacillus sp. MMS20-IR301]WNS42543.1 Gfo/Idh/MocA family oxidoreductase [Paenibacillus sp. MMS20-IR301]